MTTCFSQACLSISTSGEGDVVGASGGIRAVGSAGSGSGCISGACGGTVCSGVGSNGRSGTGFPESAVPEAAPDPATAPAAVAATIIVTPPEPWWVAGSGMEQSYRTPATAAAWIDRAIAIAAD